MNTCFTCRTRPAGNRVAGKNSAYCSECQPVPTPNPDGAKCTCANCHQTFATLTDFEVHFERFPQKHPLEGVPTGRCLEPSRTGLEQSGQVWGTPSGNANRARKAAGLRDSRLSRRP